MAEVIGVRFKPDGKSYYFSPGDIDVHMGNHVIVETSRGLEYGTVVAGRHNVEDRFRKAPLKDVIRIATEEDDRIHERNKEKEKEARRICIEKIKDNNLEMKLTDVEYAFDGSKIIFYFTADGRVDFRQLVKDLATIFKTRIELRQIGVRDESRAMGSYGICGRSICCSQFLDEFLPVSIKMAKEQSLSLNPSKISGVCGRLMCCLNYEEKCYEELNAVSPKNGALVMTPDGEGTVENVSVLKGIARVKITNENETVVREYNVCDIENIKKSERNNNKNNDRNTQNKNKKAK